MKNQAHAGQWIPVAIEELRQLARDLPVDLYLQLSGDNYCHVFSSATGLDYRRLASYRNKGVVHLFVRQGDEALLAEHRRSRRLSSLIEDPSLSAEQKAALVLNWTERTLADVFNDLPITPEAAEDSRKMVLNFVELMSRQPLSLAAMLRLISHQDYLHYHSIAVSVFSAMLARASGRYSEDEVLLISWGGFLHDIGATRMDGDFHYDPIGDVVGEERRQLELHCKLGLEIVQECPAIPKEVGYIVYQHHEWPNGRGIPNGLPRDRIYEPALLVAVVDAWSSLISAGPVRQALSPAQAFRALSESAAEGKVDSQFLQMLMRLIQPADQRAR